MRYTVDFSNRAARFVRKQTKSNRKKIGRAAEKLADSPRPAGAKKLADSGYWRIRVRDFRLVYEIRDGVALVLVVLVGRRSDVYEILRRIQKP